MSHDAVDVLTAWASFYRRHGLPPLRVTEWHRSALSLDQVEACTLLAGLPLTGGWLMRLGARPVVDVLVAPPPPDDLRRILEGEVVCSGGLALRLTRQRGGHLTADIIHAVPEPMPPALAALAPGPCETRAVLVRRLRRPGRHGATPLALWHDVAFTVAGPDADGAALRLEGLNEPWASRLHAIRPAPEEHHGQ